MRSFILQKGMLQKLSILSRLFPCWHMVASITEEMVYEATMKGRDETVDELLYAALEGDFSRGRKLIDEMIVEKGLLGVEILEGLSEALVDSGETDEAIARLIVKISETDALLKDAANERIQLEKLISTFS